MTFIKWGWQTPIFRAPIKSSRMWNLRLWGFTFKSWHFGAVKFYDGGARTGETA